MTRMTLLWGLMVPAAAIALAGCGHPSTPVAATHHHKNTAHHHAAKSTSPTSPSTSPSVSVSASTSTSTTLPVQSASTEPQPVVTAAPPGGGVATPNQVQATVNSVLAEGTVTVSGQTEHLYLINLTLHNTTTGMILFPLNDVIVGPSHTTVTRSRNDYRLTGITQQNSLFPYPIVPNHPQAVVRQVPSGASVTGSLTVEVPSASRYAIWISGENAPIATFSA